MSYATIAEIDAFNERCDRDYPQPAPGILHWKDPRASWHKELWSGEPLSERRRSLVLDAAEMNRVGGDPFRAEICAQCVRDALHQRPAIKHIISLTADEVAAWLELPRTQRVSVRR